MTTCRFFVDLIPRDNLKYKPIIECHQLGADSMEERLNERPQSGKRIILLASAGVLHWMKLTLMRAFAPLFSAEKWNDTLL